MRSLASFASLLAVGLLVGGVLMLATSQPDSQTLASDMKPAAWLDFRSMLIGLLLGLLLANLSRVPWTELPRLIVSWVLSHTHRIEYLVLAAIFAAIIVFY